MRYFHVKYLGKTLFLISFCLGTLLLLTYLLTHSFYILACGLFGILIGGFVNFLAFLGLIIYSIFDKHFRRESLQSAFMILCNVPIAFIYGWVVVSY